MRVESSARISEVAEFMREKWGLQNPNLIISVTGGAKDFQLKERVERQFKRGLIRAASQPKSTLKEENGFYYRSGGKY